MSKMDRETSLIYLTVNKLTHTHTHLCTHTGLRWRLWQIFWGTKKLVFLIVLAEIVAWRERDRILATLRIRNVNLIKFEADTCWLDFACRKVGPAAED